MKTQIGIICVLLSGMVAMDAVAERDGPWVFDNLSAIILPAQGVRARRIADGQSVALLFEQWSVEIEQAIRQSLKNSPLKYRIHPGRQAAMSVEIYSLASDVDFTARYQNKKTHILIGEIRPERAVGELLDMTKTPLPLAKPTKRALAAGQLAMALTEMRNRVPREENLRYLSRARQTALEVIWGRSRFLNCPELPEPTTDSAYREGVYLAAWCKVQQRKLKDALEYLYWFRKTDLVDHYYRSAIQMQDRIIANELLTAIRADLPTEVGVRFITYNEYLTEKPADIFLLETVTSYLIDIGMSDDVAIFLQSLATKSKDKRMTEFAPILAESYLVSGNRVRAADTASFFLSKKQPDWLEGRLRVVRGRYALQEGNWIAAVEDLDLANQLLAQPTLEHKLSRAEAHLRAKKDATTALAILDEIAARPHDVDRAFRDWFGRIWGEAKLLKGERLTDRQLKLVPPYILLGAAKRALADNDIKQAIRLLEQGKKGKSGWHKLAAMAGEVEKLRQKIKQMKSVLEVTQ